MSAAYRQATQGKSSFHFLTKLGKPFRIHEKKKKRCFGLEVDAPTLLAYNFAILVKNYFAGFYFRDFNSQIWKKSIKFRVLDVILSLKF